MKSTIKFLVLTMLLMLALATIAGCTTLEHTWAEATCTAPKTCTDCGITEGEALGHTEQIIEGQAATCYETGLTEGKICSVCNEVLVAQKVVLSLGHDMVIDLPATATCTQPGLTAGAHCSRCDYKEEQTETPALGHSYMFPCDAHCQVCGELGNENATHTIVAVAAKAATCTATGNVAYWYCSDCGAAWADEALTQLTNQKNVVTPALGHSYMFPCDAHCMACGELTNPNAAHTIVAVAAKAATCTATGNVAYWYCSDCGAAWADEALTQVTNRMNVVIPALGHSYMFACDAHCMVCGELTNPDAAHTINFVKGTPATCTANGMADRYECSICGYCWLDEGLTLVANRMNVIIPASGHNWELGSQGCTLCGEEYVLNGSGTETDPYTIGNLFELVFFRNAVNEGNTKYNATGVYVALTADIDLASVANWTPIGNWDYSFDGNFNGNGKKIQNLTITDGNGGYVAFFGITANNTIENIVFENVTITSGGEVVAAAIAYPYYTTVKNITVCGDIAIKGTNYTAGVLGYTRLCENASNLTVSGNDGSYITGAITVGGVIADIQMNSGLVANYSNFSVSNVTITGNKCVGGISGILCNQALDGATVKNVTIVSDDSRVGIVSGAFGGAFATVKNIVTENVTGATVIIGGTYNGGAPVAAKIGDTYYATLEAALAAANGETIVLVGNVALTAPIVIEKGTAVTIDLAGFVLSYTGDVLGESMITNYGELTIKDSGATGEIFYNYVGANDASYGKGNHTISNSGTLVIDGGKLHIANLSAHAKYVVDNNSTTGDAILIVNGGHLYNYNTSAIRMFCNSTVYNNSVTINGGIVEGYCAIWGQNPGNKTVNGQLTINGGELKSTAKAYVNGSAALEDVSSALYFTIAADGGAWSETSFVKITGGLFNENVYLETAAPAVVEIGEGATFNGYVAIHIHDFVGFSCETDGVCSCGAIKPAAHTLNYVAAAVANTCLETGHDEYWECTACGAYFGDAEASYQLNPAWMFYTGDCVRPEDAADCANAPCTICGNETYGYGEHDVLACKGGLCTKCNTEIDGYGCANYDTPACEDGLCYYCGGFVAGFGHENGAWAPCEDGECSYGCGLFYPATVDHLDEDGDDYCDGCWNHLNHDVNPCLGGECSICWTYVEPAHEYFYPCDAHCMNCGELTNENAAHNIVAADAKAATCTENGNVAYWYCSDCGAAWLDEACTIVTNLRSVVIPATGHAYFYPCDPVCMNCYELTNEDAAHTIVAVEAKAATCGENGNVAYWYCSDCGSAWLDEACTIMTNLRSVVIPATGHSYGETVVAPTCTANGYTKHTCGVCGDSYNTDEVDALGHKDENGDYKCDKCSTKMLPADGTALTIPQALAIAKLMGDTYTTQKYYITGVMTNLSNTQFGNFYLKDADGNEIYIYGLYSADGKTRYDAMSYKPVNGDELTVYTVLGCYYGAPQGKSAWMDEVVIHEEHDYVSEVTAPTCYLDGYTTHTCWMCGDEFKDSVVAALGHTTEAGECERCGQTIGGAVVNNETKTADLTTLSTNTSYGSYKTTSGWQTTNCAVVGGGTSNSNPKFICIGDASNRGVVLNGKTSAKGKLVSSTLTGGISAITFQYTNVFSESKGVDITITIKQNGVAVATKKLDDNSVTQYTAETFTWDLVAEGVAVKGDFTIEISNNSPSNATSNKDRVAIWNIAWTTNY